ncbi:MAG: metallophosphoesterase [Lysobacterales bacterium]
MATNKAMKPVNRPSPHRLRIVQVSDCHLPLDPQTAYRGQSADRNLASLLPAIRRWQPDLLLLTGDASEDGSAAAYGRVSAQLSTAGAPVLALPGNHDDAAAMRRYFPFGPWAGPFQRTTRNWQLVLLDSTVPGKVPGFIQPQALEQLEQCLVRGRAEHVLLALHHQPVPVNAPWIDRYALGSAEAFLAVVDRHPRVRCITWGHVHQDFELERNGVLMLGSPSTAVNSLPNAERFTLDLGGPACRWLELGVDGTIATGLLRAA